MDFKTQTYRYLSLGLLSISCTALPISALAAPYSIPVKNARDWACQAVSENAAAYKDIKLLPSVVFEGETLPQTIDARLAAHKIPGFSIAVIRKGELVWTQAWGNQSSNGGKLACDTLFQAGSLAKPVTVFAAFRMQQKNLINFDTNIEQYLSRYHLPSGAQTESNPVTFRNIFTHRSGIIAGGYEGYPNGSAIPTDVQTLSGLPPSNAPKLEILAPPNTQLRYSGAGYTVAEIALQDRFEKDFDPLMQEWLLKPFGMKQASFAQPIPPKFFPQIARGHDSQGKMIPGGWHNHPEQAAAGLWATPSDMATFLIELHRAYTHKSKLISKASMKEFLADTQDGHSYGFRRLGEESAIFFTHNGGTRGYRAGMTINLESGDGLVYMSNSDAGANLGLEFLAAIARTEQWSIFRETTVKRRLISPDELVKFAGQYEFKEQGWKIQVLFENNGLTILFPNGDRYPLSSIVGEHFSFIHADTGVRASFMLSDAGTTIALYGQTGLKIESSGPTQ